MAFSSATYFDLEALFAKSSGESFKAALMSVDGKKLPSGKDFDPATGKLKDPASFLLNAEQAEALRNKLAGAKFQVTNVEVKPFTERPKPARLRRVLCSRKPTASLVTRRDERCKSRRASTNMANITYMRTDSTNLAQVAVDAARDLVQSQYGPQFSAFDKRVSTARKSRMLRRLTRQSSGRTSLSIARSLARRARSRSIPTFEMIWKRTIASQMRTLASNESSSRSKVRELSFRPRERVSSSRLFFEPMSKER